jgi:hypothetical protein
MKSSLKHTLFLLRRDLKPFFRTLIHSYFGSRDQQLQRIVDALSIRAMTGLELAVGTSLFIGTVYVLLHFLEKEGAIGSYWDETPRPERGGARRRYYYLTSKKRIIILTKSTLLFGN